MLVSGILKRNKGEFRCVAVGNKIKKGVLLFTWIKIKFHCRGDNKASSHKKISATKVWCRNPGADTGNKKVRALNYV